MRAEDRLTFLKGRWIPEKDYCKINSIKFDRNIVAHYTSKQDFSEVQRDAESTNMSKKMLHGDKVYSRLKSARVNEETLRWINHNINVLNRAIYEWKINPLED